MRSINPFKAIAAIVDAVVVDAVVDLVVVVVVHVGIVNKGFSRALGAKSCWTSSSENWLHYDYNGKKNDKMGREKGREREKERESKKDWERTRDVNTKLG